jgi:hypothetical protein
MTGFDNLFPKNMQAEHDIDLVNLYINDYKCKLIFKG